MVAAVRRGHSLRTVAGQFRVSPHKVQYWVQRASGQRLDRVDWSTHPCGAQQPVNHSTQAVEDQVLRLRSELLQHSDLGEFGAVAIRREWIAQHLLPTQHVPAVRTVHRILERHGVLDGHYRQRQKPPPPGWYLPDVAAHRVDLDEFDMVSGLVLQNGPEVEVFNGVSLHGGWIACWPQLAVTAVTVRAALQEHWREWGLPGYAQFDNDTRFQGPHQHPDVVGSVMRLCLSLGVTPVFAPPRETGFQAAIEALNGRWQAKVWDRFHHESLTTLQAQSLKYQAARRMRDAQRMDAAPARRPFPPAWRLDLQAHPQGQVIFLRRTNHQGEVVLLGHSFSVDPHWPHRLVRAEVDLNAQVIRFFRLRRREPMCQPLLREVPYVLPQRRFKE